MKVHQCAQCDESFDKLARLNRHMLKHTGERPFMCVHAGCVATYTRKDHLDRHVKAEHQNRRDLHCTHPGCESAFYEQSHLKRHLQTHDAVPPAAAAKAAPPPKSRKKAVPIPPAEGAEADFGSDQRQEDVFNEAASIERRGTKRHRPAAPPAHTTEVEDRSGAARGLRKRHSTGPPFEEPAIRPSHLPMPLSMPMFMGGGGAMGGAGEEVGTGSHPAPAFLGQRLSEQEGHMLGSAAYPYGGGVYGVHPSGPYPNRSMLYTRYTDPPPTYKPFPHAPTRSHSRSSSFHIDGGGREEERHAPVLPPYAIGWTGPPAPMAEEKEGRAGLYEEDEEGGWEDGGPLFAWDEGLRRGASPVRVRTHDRLDEGALLLASAKEGARFMQALQPALESNMWSCPFADCPAGEGVKFGKRSELKAHWNVVHPGEGFRCRLCGRYINSANALKGHGTGPKQCAQGTGLCGIGLHRPRALSVASLGGRSEGELTVGLREEASSHSRGGHTASGYASDADAGTGLGTGLSGGRIPLGTGLGSGSGNGGLTWPVQQAVLGGPQPPAAASGGSASGAWGLGGGASRSRSGSAHSLGIQ